MKQKYCLESVVGFKQINSSSVNKSTTKQTFTIPRSPRFQSTISNCPVSTYGGEYIQKKNIGAGIGQGKRIDFTLNHAISPGSSRYQIKNVFDHNRERKKGHTLTLQREKIAFDSYISPHNMRVPGIGRYHVQTESSVIRDRAPAFSMRKRTKAIDITQTIQPQNYNPSPTDYQNNPQKSSSLFSSRFRRISFSGSKSKRFFNADNRVPGPGQYANPTNLSKVGRYLISSHHGGTNAKFDKSKRITQFDDVERAAKARPGPGSYRQSSEFGHYDGDVYSYTRINSKRMIAHK